MAIWIQSLSWALLYSLAQGATVFAALWLVLKIVPSKAANARYHLALSSLTILLAWFVATWWQQFHALTVTAHQLTADNVVIWLPLRSYSIAGGLSDWRTFLSSLELMLPWLSACYIIGLVLMLARLSGGMLHLFSLRNTGTIIPDAALETLMASQMQQLSIKSPVKLLISVKAQVPMVIGFLKPVILLPAAAVAQLEPAQLETIILHELAHIRRHDYLVNILQTIVETILFFNPFVWIISTITRREREHCCDDLVVNNTPEPVSYALALTALAARRSIVPRMTVAATGKPTHLYNRIMRIMDTKKSPYSYSRMVATLIIIISVTGSIAWVKPSFSEVKNRILTAAGQNPASTPDTETNSPEKTNDGPLAANGTTRSSNVANGDTYNRGNNQADITAASQIPAAEMPAEIADENHPINQPVGDDLVDKATEATKEKPAEISEEYQLVNQLMSDNLVDQVKGFIVEKRRNNLFINGVKQTDEIARKYLSSLKKDILRIQVFSFDERMRMHPDATFIQLLLPATFSSGCIDTRPQKEGC